MPEPRSAPVTVPAVRAWKRREGKEPLVMVTAYDTPSARMADDAGVDLILVGDSVANNVLGYADTLQVTMDDMVRHTAAVARANPKALIVADLPWMSYHIDQAETVRNGAALVRAGAVAVKLEGGANRVPMITALLSAEIPVMGHLGLTPQSVNAMGGFRVQGRDDASAHTLVVEAKALAAAGCFAMVIEGVPAGVGDDHHRVGRRSHHRDRRRPRLRRPGAGLPRRARVQPDRSQVRAALRRPGHGSHNGPGRLRRRCACGVLSGRGRGLPLSWSATPTDATAAVFAITICQ